MTALGHATGRMKACGCLVALGIGLTAFGFAPAQAETLYEALASAYLFNPTLKAQRAALRATDEEVPIARSNFRPTITGNIQNQFNDTSVRPNTAGASGTVYSKLYSVTLNQPIFRGFRTINAIRGAEADVEAGREDLRTTEQQVLLQAVTAYMDVFRDMAILKLRQNNQRVLEEQLRATRDRFQVGEVTKTDVAQSEARVAGAISDVSAARSNLESSRATYQQIIGNPPMGVSDPGAPNRLLPKGQDEALAIANGENPSLLAAIFRERSQDHAVKQIKGELLPEVSLQASYTKGLDPQVGIQESDDTTVTLNTTIPLYEAGQVSARIRQAKETQSQLRQLIDQAREQVRADVISTWGQYIAAKSVVTSAQSQVDANRVAVAGVREEEKVGQRTVLDVLNQEQELLNSEVSLVTAKRDTVVAAYTVLQAIGRLTASDLGLPVNLYDPAAHYSRVRNKAYGWSTSVEAKQEDPKVAPVNDPGVVLGQPHSEGPAYRVDH